MEAITKITEMPIKSTKTATYRDSCFYCGHFYEVGTEVAFVAGSVRRAAHAPRDDSRYAHVSCIENHNARVAHEIELKKERDAKIPTPTLGLDQSAPSFNAALALALLERKR